MSAEPYTMEEASADIEAWSQATAEQRAKAFMTLLGEVAGIALRDDHSASLLRRIRTERDEVQP